VARDVQAAFGGDFLASLGDERGLVGPGAAGDFDDLVVAGHFQVELDGDRFAEHGQVAILDVAPVFAEVDRDAVGATQLGQRGSPNRVGLVGSPGLAESGDVVDVDAEIGHG